MPTFDFNNVTRPVPTQDKGLSIPAVTGLLYTPVFVNPTLLGAIGGYYNSVCGLTLTLAPTKNTYFSYGFYDGNIILGVQTGLKVHISMATISTSGKQDWTGSSPTNTPVSSERAFGINPAWCRGEMLHRMAQAGFICLAVSAFGRTIVEAAPRRRRATAKSEKQNRHRPGAFPALIHLDLLAIRRKQRRGAAGQSILWNGLHRVRLGAGPTRRLDGCRHVMGMAKSEGFRPCKRTDVPRILSSSCCGGHLFPAGGELHPYARGERQPRRRLGVDLPNNGVVLKWKATVLKCRSRLARPDGIEDEPD